mgnify:CR=1 FL=1
MKRRFVVAGLLIFCVIASAQTLEERYKAFQQSAQKDYSDFRTEANKKYAEFLRSSWEYFKTAPAIPVPEEKPVPPVVYDDKQKKEQEQRKDQEIIPEIVPVPEPQPQPQPIVPIFDNQQEEQHQIINIKFYGTDLKFRYPKNTTLTISPVNGDGLANCWEQLSKDEFDLLVADCLAARDNHNLCDWAYLQMLQMVAENVLGQTNEAVMLQAYVYAISGYKMRIGVSKQKKIYLLVGSSSQIYGQPYFTVDGEMFYPFNCKEDGLAICGASFEDEKPLSLFITKEQQLVPKSVQRTRNSKLGLNAQCVVNTNLIDFYNHYPTFQINDDFGTRWAAYANTPLDALTRNKLYPILRERTKGLNELQAVGQLLNWVQTAFVYEYDDKVWGQDRAFFAEESIYYPYCDCEDRSILFSRIVRDVLHLDVVLLYYPGHLATAVHFTQDVKGDYLIINGKKYVVCDPTYINAPVGATMPNMNNQTAKVIVLK